MKKILSVIILLFIFMINVNARINVSYDEAVKGAQNYIYKFNNYGRYLITDSKYRELRGSTSAIIPFDYTGKVEVNESFKRGGLLSQQEFEISKNSSGISYLIQDSEFFLIGKKAVDILENKVIDAGDKKYGTRVTEYVIPGTKVKGSGTKADPWVFVGSYKLSFYISNGKITNNGQSVNRYTVYALESNEGQIIINFEPSDGFEYQSNNCGFIYEYDSVNKIHRVYKDNKNITKDEECTIKLKSNKLIVEYDYNGGTGSCESLAVTYGSKINNLCTSVSKEGYTFSGWKDENGNTITNDTVINDNIKVYAQWTAKETKLTINPNGGVWNNKTETQTISQAYNTTTTINNPSKGAVYTITFDANNQGATISKSSIEAERAFNSWEFTISKGDTTSKFENNIFTFGSEDVAVTANYNTTSNQTTLSTISKTGYLCKWNTASDGSGISYSSGYSGYTTTSNVKLYAICTSNLYKVTFNNQGATDSGTTSTSVAYGNTISSIKIPSKIYKVTFVNGTNSSVSNVSYTFGGYYTSTNGGGTQYIDANGGGSRTYNLTSNTTLYAKWTGGTISLPSVSKTGYTFDGWYTSSSGGSYVGGASYTYKPTSNITLYAQFSENTTTNYTLTVYPNGGIWNDTYNSSTYTGSAGDTKTISNPSAPSYTVSFNTNGGTSVSSKTASSSFKNWSLSGAGTLSGTKFTYGYGNSTLIAYYNVNSITLPSTSRTGYTFAGWYTSSSGGTYIGGANSTYKPTSNIKLYAHWTANTTTDYTLTVYPNGGIWNDTYNSSTFTGSAGDTKTISNPTAPSYTVSFNTNGGTSVSSKTASSSFKNWSLSGAGTLSGTKFTYGYGNSTLIAYYNVNSITLPSTSKTGYTFNGWYTSSSGGTRVGGSNSTYTPSSSTTLYAQWTANTSTSSSYYISYNLNNGSHGAYHPTSATYDSVVNISNPTKTVTVNLSNGSTSSGASISSTSVSATQTFAGWTASNLNTSTARYGSYSSSVTTQWSNGSTKVKNTYFKNLTSTNNATVTLTANWTQKNITLPTITKSGYECGWSTSSSSSVITYASGSTYAPSASGSSSINLYGVCKAISAPSLKVTFTTSAGYSNYCTDTYTTSNGGCTFTSSYYAPITLKVEATDTNTVSTIKFEYNSSGQSSYTNVNSSDNLSITKSGNTYTATRTISSTGKRKFKVTATNNVGKSSVVIMNLNVIEQSFASQYSCASTALTSGYIYTWKAGSTCTTAESDTSKCSEGSGSEYFGIINGNQTICVKELNWLSNNTVRVNAYVPQSAFYTLNGNAYKNGNYSSVTYNNVKYYYVTMPVWCNASSCNYGWVVNDAAQQQICPSIKTKNSTLYNKIC